MLETRGRESGKRGRGHGRVYTPLAFRSVLKMPLKVFLCGFWKHFEYASKDVFVRFCVAFRNVLKMLLKVFFHVFVQL